MEKIKPYLSTLFLLALCAVMPKCAFGTGLPWHGVFLYHFSHANLWHLAANFLVLTRFRPKWENLPVAYLCATASAIVLMPMTPQPTVGLSGMIFAMLARRDAIFRELNWKLMAANLLFIFLPNFNWQIHLISYLTAYFTWTIIQKNR